MHDAHAFLRALSIVLGAAAVTSVVFQKLKQPVVVGYVLAGLLVGPHVPIPLVADSGVVTTLSELGVILLMSSIGLEFSLSALVRVGPVATFTAIVETSLMFWLGFLAGRGLGLSDGQSFFAGAMVSISSTTVIAKVFAEAPPPKKLRNLVFGILVIEDLIAVGLLAAITAFEAKPDWSPWALVRWTTLFAVVLATLIALGLFLVPRAARAVLRLHRAETTLVASVGFTFAAALLAAEFGVSVALGAFLAGALLGESGVHREVSRVLTPVRDMFVAVFFVSVGMSIEPQVVLSNLPRVLGLTLLVVVGKVFGVAVGAFLAGNGIRNAVLAGMTMAQIGEFSFIIVGLAVSLGRAPPWLFAVCVAVSALTTLTTPWLHRVATPVASAIDRKLPRSLQTYAALYGSWFERFFASSDPGHASKTKHLVRRLLLDSTLLTLVVVGAAVATAPAVAFAGSRFGVPPSVAKVIALTLAAFGALPFAVGTIRLARGLGFEIARTAFPAVREGMVDLAAAPRRAFVVSLQLALVWIVGLPTLAITQPFLPGWVLVAVLLPLALGLGVSFWRTAKDLEGHVRAGAETIVEALVRARGAPETGDPLAMMRATFPGLGEPVVFRVERHHHALGQTLAELDLRGKTGGSVLASCRGDHGMTVPSPTDPLREGDLLAIAGTTEAIDAACKLLRDGEPNDARSSTLPVHTPHEVLR